MNWNLPKQTIFSNWGDEKQPPGDCWRCCVAAVLQIPAEVVPHFAALNQGDADTQRFLNARGYGLLRFNHGFSWENGIFIPQFGGDKAPEIPVIMVGPTVRSKQPRQYHAVVMMDQQMVYDPHPSEAGLLIQAYGYLIVRLTA